MKSIRTAIPTLLLTAAVVFSGSAAFAAAEPETEQPPPLSFYQQLSHLISRQDDSFFFGTIRLSIGSDLITVDGVSRQLTGNLQLCNDRTMIPMESLSQLLGVETAYDPQIRCVTITSRYGEQIICPVDADTITVEDTLLALDVGACISDHQVLLPLRAAAEALSMTVEWEPESSSILLTAPYQTARVMVSAETLDLTQYPAHTAALNDGNGFWVLQFHTPGQARKSVQMLKEQGYMVQPDLYFPSEIMPD